MANHFLCHVNLDLTRKTGGYNGNMKEFSCGMYIFI